VIAGLSGQHDARHLALAEHAWLHGGDGLRSSVGHQRVDRAKARQLLQMLDRREDELELAGPRQIPISVRLRKGTTTRDPTTAAFNANGSNAYVNV